MKYVVLFLLVYMVNASAVLGQNKYGAARIADSLKQDASAVIRNYSTSYDRKSPEKYTLDVHIAITIMNQNGIDEAELVIHYDRNSKVSKVRGVVYNAQGLQVSEVKKNDLRDYAISAGYTLFSDSRVLQYNPAVPGYPFTVEYIYTVEYTGTVGFNTWLPQRSFGMSVEDAELLFTVTAGSDIRFREVNHRFESGITEAASRKTYKWKVSDLPAVAYEPKAPAFLDIMPAILLAPDKIVYEGIAGDFSTWDSYGRWVNGLIASRDQLPEATVQRIRSITEGLPDIRSKAAAVYQYMQGRTRYVNIALGIGGFQPMTAAVVDEKGYGDCKALSNYTRALLKAAGIGSFYAEIGTGQYHNIRFPDYSSTNQTNHVMLCVPMEADTVWLECTNQKLPFGYIGLTSQGRYALMATPGGGTLARTTSFKSMMNSRSSKVSCTLGESGTPAFSLLTTYSNNLYSEIFGLMNLSAKEQRETLLKALSGSRPVTIGGFTVKDNSGTGFIGELSVQGTIGNYPQKAGSRMIFEPMFFHSAGLTGPLPEKRKLPVVEPVTYTCTDTFHVDLPVNHAIEYLPEARSFSNCYGSYAYETFHEGHTITIVRQLTINKGTYHQSQFAEINEFMKAVTGGESRKIVVKEEG
jgi:hypothetical protein